MFVSGLADIPVDVYLLNVMIIAFFIYMLQSNITLDRNWHLFKLFLKVASGSLSQSLATSL